MGKPKRFRSLSNSHTRSTVSSRLRSVESIKTASEAIDKGETLRFESILSRPSKEVLISAVVAPETSDSLRNARASRSAVK